MAYKTSGGRAGAATPSAPKAAGSKTVAQTPIGASALATEMSDEFKLQLRKQIKSLKKTTGKLKVGIKDLQAGRSDIVSDEQPTSYSKQEKAKQEVLQEHGTISTAENKDGSQEKYTGRFNYKKVYNDHARSIIDTWYDLPFFTRTDEFGVISAIDLDESDLVSVDDIKMVNFVADAFRNMAREYNARANSPSCCRGLNKTSTMIPELVAVKSYINELEAQDEYLEDFYVELNTKVLSRLKNSEKIKNIDDFYRYLKVFIRDTGRTLSTPGFMEGNFGSIYMSGMAVDVLDDAPDDDVAKIKFLDDPNFKIFQNLAFKYNFKIDINVPWRLIFDYRTSKAAQFLKKWPSYRLQYQENLTPYASYHNFSTRYNGFAQILVRFYHRFIGENPTYNIISNIGHFSNKSAMLKQNRIVEVQKTQGPLVFVNKKYLSWYAEIRNLERGESIDSTRLKLLKKRVNHMYLHASTGAKFAQDANIAVNYIEYVLGSIASQYHGKSLTSLKEDPIMLMNMIKLPRRVISNFEKKSVETTEDLFCSQSQGFKQCYFVELPDGKFYWTKDPDGEIPQSFKDNWAK
jgi:hypothetical protein